MGAVISPGDRGQCTRAHQQPDLVNARSGSCLIGITEGGLLSGAKAWVGTVQRPESWDSICHSLIASLLNKPNLSLVTLGRGDGEPTPSVSG